MVDLIYKYFGDVLNKEQKDQYAMMWALYNEWNNKINVVSRKDIENLYLKHVLHSLGIAKAYQFKDGDTVMDLGCGGGFPGIPLAVMFPNVQFKMVDSIGKKITVVSNVAAELGLSNVVCYNSRGEDLDFKVDYVVSRGVAELNTFLGWCWKRVNRGGGVLYLKGGENLNNEVDFALKNNALGAKCDIYDINSYFEEDFFDTKKVIHVKK